MLPSNYDIVRWTHIGLAKGAKAMLIIKSPFMEDCYPVWIMPGESLERAKLAIEKESLILDAVNLMLAKALFNDIFTGVPIKG